MNKQTGNYSNNQSLTYISGWTLSIASGIASTLAYFKIYTSVLTKFKECFTLGEAGLVSQSITMIFYFTAVKLVEIVAGNKKITSNMQVATLIIQFELLCVGLIAWLSYIFLIKTPKRFYTMCFLIITFVFLLPLKMITGEYPILWIISLIDNIPTIKLMMYWSFCTGVAILSVSNQIFYAKKASTGKRKIFHILCVAVYIPGLLCKCSLLYLASGMLTGAFFFLEILRLLRMPPLGIHLHDGFVVFSDEKDTLVALTPIYLLVGCSIPIWIHPSPCDVTDSGLFNMIPLMSGLLAIGLGDTAASIVGSSCGRVHWPRSKKTFEGTIACMLTQAGMVYLLAYLNFIYTLSHIELVKIGLSIIVSSIVEAKTSQVDNLVLPLITYIILMI
ncbi:unnamed protein product [Acanthoscelides obtectus]|uniref:dolichol kinase n=1 Tax=Acanthoscelides obtectus TaxID=200917 RepID=A0A9P0L5X6_ACAOB|nr:unnamed protein product [Acanthoscelides obtectus]CAK1635170.1 Dolichol kinase [Acanthoscelides obtectus]